MRIQARPIPALLIISLLSLLSLLFGGTLAAASADNQLVDTVKTGQPAAVKALLQRQTDVNAPEVDGTTALHWAARQNDLTIVKLLVGAGANVKAANRYGVTPLALACVARLRVHVPPSKRKRRARWMTGTESNANTYQSPNA